MYYAKLISAWLGAFMIGFLILLFAPPVLKEVWFEISMLLLLCFYYLLPPVLITGISDLKQASAERPFMYFWEITGAIGLTFFFTVRLVFKLMPR